MIDVAKDELIHVEEVAKRFPRRNGKARSVKSVLRWISHGLKGVKLEAAPMGEDWYTTDKAIQKFSDAQRASKTSYGDEPKKVSRSSQSKRQEHVKRRLKAKGFK